jgi:hypothetical protein
MGAAGAGGGAGARGKQRSAPAAIEAPLHARRRRHLAAGPLAGRRSRRGSGGAAPPRRARRAAPRRRGRRRRHCSCCRRRPWRLALLAGCPVTRPLPCTARAPAFPRVRCQGQRGAAAWRNAGFWGCRAARRDCHATMRRPAPAPWPLGIVVGGAGARASPVGWAAGCAPAPGPPRARPPAGPAGSVQAPAPPACPGAARTGPRRRPRGLRRGAHTASAAAPTHRATLAA